MYRRAQARKVKRRARTLQVSTYFPKSRTVTISDTRTFSTVDDGHYIDDHENRPLPLLMCFNVNDPSAMWKIPVQGTWRRTDYGTYKGDSMPGLSKWVTNNVGDGPGLYRYCMVTKTKVTVTVRPTASVTDTSYHVDTEAPGYVSAGHDAQFKGLQSVCRCVLTKVTAFRDLPTNRTPDANFNADERSRKPYTVSADVYNTRSGNSKGVTMTQTYYHKAMNASGSPTRNHIYSNTSTGNPIEKDHMYFGILPTNTNWHRSEDGTTEHIGFNTCGKFHIQVQVDCTLKLSEPNTSDNAMLPNEGSGAFDQIVPR